MSETQFYAKILGISKPWSVASVTLLEEEQKVKVCLSFAEDFLFRCPQCNKKSPRYDKVRRRWRHLDTCEYGTVIEADIPRINCSEHGVLQVTVSWTEPCSRYTFPFEAQVLR